MKQGKKQHQRLQPKQTTEDETVKHCISFDPMLHPSLCTRFKQLDVSHYGRSNPMSGILSQQSIKNHHASARFCRSYLLFAPGRVAWQFFGALNALCILQNSRHLVAKRKRTFRILPQPKWNTTNTGNNLQIALTSVKVTSGNCRKRSHMSKTHALSNSPPRMSQCLCSIICLLHCQHIHDRWHANRNGQVGESEIRMPPNVRHWSFPVRKESFRASMTRSGRRACYGSTVSWKSTRCIN